MKMETEAARPKRDTAEAHFSSFAEPLVDEAISHATALNSDPDAELLHKLRVVLRRLRSLLWAYRPLLDRDLDDKQRALFKSLAGAAGKTRDWDILTKILTDVLGAEHAPIDSLRAARSAALNSSRETLAHASIKSTLEDAFADSSEALSAMHKHTPVRKFSRKRLESAEKSLHKRMRHAAQARRSDYATYHEVRKAGKKVRYLLDVFEPVLTKKEMKSVKELKKIQKRFGALNDVVASEEVLRNNPHIFRDDASTRSALAALEKERKQRARAAAELLR